MVSPSKRVGSSAPLSTYNGIANPNINGTAASVRFSTAPSHAPRHVKIATHASRAKIVAPGAIGATPYPNTIARRVTPSATAATIAEIDNLPASTTAPDAGDKR